MTTPNTGPLARFPSSRAVAYCRCLIATVVTAAFGILTMVVGIHGQTHHDDSAPSSSYLRVGSGALVAQVGPADMTDAQLAAELTAACGAHPGACRHTPTDTDVESEFVPYVCAWIAQPTAPAGAGTPAWRAAWPQIASIVAATGRCTNPADSQLAAELAWLPGASGTPMSAADLAEVVKHACPEIGGPVPHTTYAAGVLRVLAASGRC